MGIHAGNEKYSLKALLLNDNWSAMYGQNSLYLLLPVESGVSWSQWLNPLWVLKIPVKYSSFSPHGIFSVLFKERDHEDLCLGRRHTETEMQTQTCKQINKTTFRQAQIQTHTTHRKNSRHREREVENSNLGFFLGKFCPWIYFP